MRCIPIGLCKRKLRKDRLTTFNFCGKRETTFFLYLIMARFGECRMKQVVNEGTEK